MDAFLLRKAFALAETRRGFCSPNPSVGAVVVKNGEVVGEGFHLAAGHPHAEVEALKSLSTDVTSGSTLYVTLEPCCHFGKTPPCTDAILKAGVSEVVYAYADPNPLVSGKGHEILATAGVRVRHVSSQEADAFYASYRHWTRNRRPYVTAKLAMSLDGKTAAEGGRPIALTGAAAGSFTHIHRLKADALLTTAATVIADNPQLNARVDGSVAAKPLYVLDAFARTPESAQIFQSALSTTFFVSRDANRDRLKGLKGAGARLVELPASGGRFEWGEILAAIGENGVHDLWIEAGATLFASLLASGNAQKAYLFISAVMVGSKGVSAFESPWSLSEAQIAWTAQGRDVLAEVVW